MRVDSANREITCKVVYYGPGLSGKTTNLKQIHDRAPSRAVGELVTLDTHSERTLHFDLLPMDLGQVRGHQVRFEFYTVPGQSYYASTRRLVLDGADGVVFVADSRREALDENIDSMNDLLDNLRHLKLPEDLPVVMQYNKQDLPSALKPEQLDPLLNSRRWPSLLAVATSGQGVIETMRAISSLVLERVKQAPGASASGSAPALQTPAPSSTWLITCYRCQNMLETQGAKRGDLFTCGACGTPLEIVDLEHGVTRAPAPAATHAAGSGSRPALGSGGHAQLPASAATYVPTSLPPRDDSGSYSLQPAAPETSALGVGSGPHGVIGEGQPFELAGFEQLALIDENVQGRRYRVRETATGAKFRALALNPTLLRQPGYAQQIEPYARMAAQAKHAHILPLHSLHQGAEAPILLTAEPADHETLAHVLARRRVLAPPHAMQVARQLVLALEEAARHGVIHGWLRPEIVLLNADSVVALDEMGVAKNHRYLVRELSGASAATEYYLAPEHLSDDVRSDIRSDMFMLGALIFRMLTGEGLVTGYTAHEALHKVVASGCRTARSVQPNLSRDLDGFIQRLVATERKDRPQTWREVLDLCDRFGGGAKRQTFRLTQGHAGPAGGTARTARPAAPATTRHPRTGSHTRSPSSGVRSPESGSTLAARRRERAAGGGGFGIVLVVLLLLALAGGAMFVLTKPNRPPQAPPTPTAAPTTTAPTPIERERGPNPTPPTAIANPGKSAANPTAPTRQPIAPPTPAPNETLGELMVKIADAERAGRFGEALKLCERLPGESAQVRAQDVMASHRSRRADIERRVRGAASLDEARGALDLAIATWKMPGDDEWAQEMMKVAGQDAVRAPETATPPTPTPTATQPSPTGKRPPAAEAHWALEQALARSNVPAAEQALATVPAEAPESAAMRRKFEIWKERPAVLAQAIAARKPILRVPNPTDGQQWDVVGVEDAGLQVSSPSGSRTTFTWQQVAVKDLARVAADAAAGGKDGREHALAVALLTISGETALATVQLKGARAAIGEEAAKDLELGIALHKQFEAWDAVKRADDALKAGNAKAAGEAIEVVRKAGGDAAAELPRLEDALRRIQEGAPAAALRDKLAFDAAEDLQSLPLRDGEWTVQGGAAICSSTSGSLGRKDLANGRSLTVGFHNNASRGALVVTFRGVRVLCDFAKGTVTAGSLEQQLKPIEFAFIPRTAHFLYIELRGAQAVVEVNNGAALLDLKLPTRSPETMEIRLDTNAAVQIDELAITREVRVDPVADAKRIAEIRAIGFEPIGQAQLVPPAIVLPKSAGIGVARRDTIASLTFEARGTGRIEVRLGKIGEGGGQVVALDLGKKPEDVVKYTVGWSGGRLTVRRGDADGDVFIEDKLNGDPPHVMLVATTEAVITSTPRLNRQ